MAFFDFLKKEEHRKISHLEDGLKTAASEIERLQAENRRLQAEIERLQTENDYLQKYRVVEDAELERERIFSQIEKHKKNWQDEKEKLTLCVSEKENEYNDLLSQIDLKKGEIVELDEKILLQEYGIYTPLYECYSLEQYKSEIDNVRLEQKELVLNGNAAICLKSWVVNGSEAKGKKMTEQNIKQIIRCFNDECDVLINKVKFNNVTAYTEKICKSAAALNKMNTHHCVSLSDEYIALKIKELRIVYEHSLAKQKEKEEQRADRERLREEARLQKEIEEARKEIEKEQRHYANALLKVTRQIDTCTDVERELLQEKKSEIESHLSDLDVAIKNIDYREANKKAGYVYIISNIGSFGENVYKIGMTRRLDPMERVYELGDASVPFLFDVHAMIFSDDAPKLEAALHQAFADKKVNMVNWRREFFNVTLDEIESVVRANYDKTVEFIRVPQAEQFRESLRLRGSEPPIS